MKKMVLVCMLIIPVCSCVHAKWDTDTLEVTSIGANKEINGLTISQEADGSFGIGLEKSTVEGQESMIAIMQAIYEAGLRAGAVGIVPQQ